MAIPPARQGPTHLGAVLAGTRAATLKRSRAAVDRDTWKRAVGRRIAERTEVGALRGDELTVYVASAAWAQELSLLTREITGCLEALAIQVTKIRFQVRSDLGRAPARAVRAPKKKQPVLPLPPELEARLSRIADDELRAAIAQAAGLALARVAKKPVSAAQPKARDPRAAEARNARQAPESAGVSSANLRKRGERSG